MKGPILTFLIAVSAIALNVQDYSWYTTEVSVNESAMFQWAETSFDFGKIKANVPVTHEFAFTNTGNAALVISSVQTPCGCTVASYSKDPVLPGQKGYVKATYNAAKPGMFTKTITVLSNSALEPVKLTIRGEVAENL